MSPVHVVVALVLVKRMPKVGFVPDQHAVQQFGTQSLYPALHDRVHAGHPDTSQQPDLREVSGVLKVHEQVADGRGRPGMRGVRGDAENAHASAGMVDGGEDVLALPARSG